MFSEFGIFIFLLGFIIGYLFALDRSSRRVEVALVREIDTLLKELLSKDKNDLSHRVQDELKRAKKSVKDIEKVSNRSLRIEYYRKVKYFLIFSEAQIDFLENVVILKP